MFGQILLAPLLSTRIYYFPPQRRSGKNSTLARRLLNLRLTLTNWVGGNGYDFGKDFVLKASLYLTQDLPIQYKVKNFTRSNLRKIEENWDNVKTYLATTIRLVAKFGYLWENIVAEFALLPIAFWLMKRGEEFFDKSSKPEKRHNTKARSKSG